MVHLNSNILCAVSIETTGPIPIEHEIWQIAVVPLNSRIEIDKTLMPFSLTLKPHHPMQVDPKWVPRDRLAQACISGMDPYQAADLFESWLDKLNLPQDKKIMALTHDWFFVATFLRQWLQPTQFKMMFHEWVRDLIPVSLYANDSADMHAEPVPYAKSNFTYLCSTLKVERPGRYDCLVEAGCMIECYKRMLRKLF